MLREDYKDLVNSPNETPAVEYKSWLDLSDNEARADVARHIAAIANYGGGMIVFGFNDAGLTYAGPNPHTVPPINRDTISGIVRKYLEPTFHCDVEHVQSTAGNIHPIVVIPSHGAIPICARASGPQVGTRIKGIEIGTYYVRKPGPESAPVVNAAEWGPIIRRCALHEKASILSAVSVALRGETEPPARNRSAELKRWHDAAYTRFKSDVTECGASPELIRRNVQLSYLIVQPGEQRLNVDDLRHQGLLQINSEVKDRVRTGWSMFYPFTRREIEPRIMIDEASGEGQDDFVETALVRARESQHVHTDLWRVTPAGKATIIRPYWEDNPDWASQTSREPGSWFSPNLECRSVAEFVRHAQALAERFETAESVLFLCEWRGLLSRTIYEPGSYFSIEGESATDGRITTQEVPVGDLGTAWPEIVSNLVAPIVRLFSGSFRITPEYVRGRAPTWARD